MSRPPRRRRPQRTFRWEGVVTEVCSDRFWARLAATDHEAPELEGEFALALLPGAEAGMVFNAYAHHRGRRIRTVLRERDLGRWTAEELEAAQARAAAWVRKVSATWLEAS